MVVLLNPELVEGESRTSYGVEGHPTLFAGGVTVSRIVFFYCLPPTIYFSTQLAILHWKL